VFFERALIGLGAAALLLGSAAAGAADRAQLNLPSGSAGISNAPSLARGDGRLVVASHVRGAAGLVAEAALFDEKSGDLLARVPLSSGTSLAANPKVAASPHGFGAVWFDDEAGGAAIRFASFDPDGRITVARTAVSDGAGSAFDPVIVRGAGEWGIFWFQMVDGGSAIHFASVSDDGRILVAPRRLSGPASWSHYPSADFADGRWAVAWHARSGNRFGIRFRTFDRNGDPLTPERALSDAGSAAWYPSVSFARGELAVAWHELRDGSWGISFLRLAADGTPASAPHRLPDAGRMPMFPSLAPAADGWLLSWSDRGGELPRAGMRLLGTDLATEGRTARFVGGPGLFAADFPRPLADGSGALVACSVLENGRESIRIVPVDLGGEVRR
jgi:hypothetical protein